MVRGLRFVVEAAPTPIWPWAMESYCYNDNTQPDASCGRLWYWFQVLPAESPGERLPLRCKVIYKPAGARPEGEPGRWQPQSKTGIFAGYAIESGYQWTGMSKVWDMRDFVGFDIHIDNPGKAPRLSIPPNFKVALTR